jgi:hypothetical protein
MPRLRTSAVVFSLCRLLCYGGNFYEIGWKAACGPLQSVFLLDMFTYSPLKLLLLFLPPPPPPRKHVLEAPGEVKLIM